MPMNTNLIPTRITNKNGVSTTVYKSAPSPTKNTDAPLPAPSIKSKRQPGSPTLTHEERKDAIERFVTLANKGNDMVIPGEDAKLRAGLQKYNDELLIKLLDRTKRSDSSKDAFILAIQGKSQKYVNKYLALHGDDYDLIFTPIQPGGFSSKIHNAVNSLDTYPQLPYKHTDEYYQKAIALTGVVAAIQDKIPDEHSTSTESTFLTNSLIGKNGEYQLLSRLTNDDLVNFILERPEQWKEIADIITTRQTQDPETIREVLDYEVTTLRDGTL